MTTKKKFLLWVGAFLLVCAALFALLPNPEARRLQAPERKQWKEQAIARIGTHSGDLKMISNEIAVLHAEAANQSGDGWIGTNVVLLTNGEWLVYENNCVKEPNHIHDLFLARGSDGQWYYSTFHFCIDMIVPRTMEDKGPPGSISEFTNRYSAHEFDGKSDECLKKTWPVKR